MARGVIVTLKYTHEALLVFVILALTYGYFYHDPDWNGNSRLGLIFAVVREGRLSIDSYHNEPGLRTGDKSFYNGHYYSDKAIGTSLLGVLVYLPIYHLARLTDRNLPLKWIKYLLTLFVIGLPSAFAGSLMYTTGRALSASKTRAYIVTMALALGTMAFPFSTIFFGHQLAAALLFTAFFFIFRFRFTPVIRNSSLFLIGLLLGFALITEYTIGVLGLLLIGYYFYTLWARATASQGRLWRYTTIVLPALGGLIPLTILLIYNTLCFGSPFSLGYQHLEAADFKEGMGRA